MKNDNDNEPFSFVSLAALTANVVRYLEIEKKETAHHESSSNDEEKHALERLEFVNRRLRELERFEDRARGRK